MASIEKIFEVAVPEGSVREAWMRHKQRLKEARFETLGESRTRVTVSVERDEEPTAEQAIEDFKRSLSGTEAAGNPAARGAAPGAAGGTMPGSTGGTPAPGGGKPGSTPGGTPG